MRWDPLNRNFYKGIKLLEHAFKLYEKILDGRLREVVNIDKMQFGFMPGREIASAVFVLRGLNEKFRAKKTPKNISFFIFVKLETLLIECQGKLFVLPCGGRVSQKWGKWGYLSL